MRVPLPLLALAVALAGVLLVTARPARAAFGVTRISARGLDAIKRHEGFRAEAYRDVAGFPTIGYGHKIEPGEAFGVVDEIEAARLLVDDVQTATDAVARLVEVPLSQGELDALVSFVFNVGAGAFAASTLLKKLNDGDRAGAAQEFDRWAFVTVQGQKVRSAGLANRRAAERKLFEGKA